MKNFNPLILLALLLSQLSFSQAGTTFNENGRIDSRSIVTNGRVVDKPSGSEYISETFVPANIPGSVGLTLIRYNGYKDELELKNSIDGIAVLPAEKDVVVSTTDKKNAYVYTDFVTDDNEKVTGYLNILSDKPQVKIYSRSKVFLQEATEPTSGYQTYKPANYRKSPVKYFIKVKDNSIVSLTKKKDVLAQFPGREKEINEFVKTNKISFSEEADLKKLGDFLNNLNLG